MSANSPRPVLVAVGETSVSVPADLTLADSPLDMMVRAAKATLHDASNNRIAAQLDTIVAVRTMSESAPHLKSPFGDAENYPRAVAQRLGITPKHALYSQIGGQTPQALVNQYAAAIAAGETRAVLIVGGEATANQKALKKAGIAADWRVLASGECDTQGVDPFDILDAAQLANELFDIAAIYTLFDHAHRARLGKTREAYAQHCANLFAPFSEVAASHSNALQNRALSAAQIAAVSEDNPAITDCYTRAMVAKDGVNQAAGLILMQEELAIEIGLDPSQFVYPLAGTESTEKTISMRTDLSSAPAMQAAYDVVFEATGLSVEDIDCFDLYSCFPIAVFCACNALGIDADDPRGLTLTGGLPFFGGPGNNYSMHAIVQLAHRLRRRSQGLGLIGANGG
ncbi:MAG: acetyl-CoA acetyltransferase, partial [Pseudomonadota bacterium]